MTESSGRGRGGATPIVVQTTEELKAALVAGNAGRRILVRAGTYGLDGPLVVPERASLEGAGDMLGGDLPTGFEPGTETRIVARNTFAGDLLRLRDQASLRGFLIEDVSDREGNAIGVVSHGPATTVAASIAECEIINPNGPGGLRDGPTGGAIVALTRNLARGDPPLPDEDAAVEVELRRSIVRAEGRALFAMNFASGGRVKVRLEQNLIAGALDVVGGISRPDEVVQAAIAVESRDNLYAPPSAPWPAWLFVGGSSPPRGLFQRAAATSANAVRLVSRDDRIEGAGTLIAAIGGRRLSDDYGPSSDNTVDLRLHGLTLQTRNKTDADLELAGALTLGHLPPGDRNRLRVLIRDSNGSAPPRRPNSYAHVFAPTGGAHHGVANRLAMIGTANAFAQSNEDIDRAPKAAFFTG
jgi:hypothetical protein